MTYVIMLELKDYCTITKQTILKMPATKKQKTKKRSIKTKTQFYGFYFNSDYSA